MDAGNGKVKGTGRFYHPFAALTRATEDTEEKQEKTFKDLDLGLNPKNRFLVKDFICVHLRASAAKKGGGFRAKRVVKQVLVFKVLSANICAICVQGFESRVKGCLVADGRR